MCNAQSCRLLTGRRLLKSLIPAFLKRGSTNASFHMVGKCPPNNDEFIILVMTGNSTSKQAITSGFDVGSNPHVFFNDFWMSVKTSFFVRDLNIENICDSLALGSSGTASFPVMRVESMS